VIMKTSAIILSYKDDCVTIGKTVSAVERCGVDEIVLIDNGGFSNLIYLKNVKLFATKKNLGSSGGYKYGLQRATQDYFWLLDADNVPEPDALDILKENYNGGAVCSYRKRYGAIANLNSYDLKPITGWNSVLGFNVLHPFRRNKIFGIKEPMRYDVSKIPVATYGGMFFNRALIHIIGYPDKRYFTYADDYAWSRRIVDIGMDLLLVRDSIIEDSK